MAVERKQLLLAILSTAIAFISTCVAEWLTCDTYTASAGAVLIPFVLFSFLPTSSCKH